MKQTTKVLLSAVLTIALCLSVISGATFALFTSEAQTNIAVTAGKVKVNATISDLVLTTSLSEYKDNDSANGYTFQNGGTAEINGGTLTLTNVTPGDIASFKINVKNESNVDIQYRVVTEVSGNLAQYLKVTADGEVLTNNVGEWKPITADKTDNDDEFEIDMVVALPESVGDEAQEKTANIVVKLEAVQGNGTEKYDDAAKVANTDEFWAVLANAEAGKPLYIILNGDIEYKTEDHHGEENITPASSVVIDGQGKYTLTATGSGVTPIGDTEAPLTLKNLTVKDTSTSYAEGAWELTYLELGGPSLICDNVTFADEIQIGTNATFTNCTFESNEENVYAVWVYNGDATFEGCTFTGTRGIKVHEDYGTEVGTVVIDNCLFNGLTQKPGVAIDTATANITIKNSTFINCQPGDQDKYIYETDNIVPTLENNTVLNNVTATTISTKEELLKVSAKAFTGNDGTAEEAVIVINADIDMQGDDFSAIIAQRGDKLTIIGNGHTISNAKVISGANDNKTGQASMFYAYPNSTLTVSDLILKDITVTADKNDSGFAAAVVGYCEGTAVLNNVDVVNATVTGVKSSGMLVGHLSGSLSATNCDVWGTVTLADFAEEANGHYAGKYIGTLAGAATLTACTANVAVSGELHKNNIGDIFGRTVNGSIKADVALGISTAEQLFAFAEDVNKNGNSYSGKTVVLTADIDLENKAWTPIGQTRATEFKGIFDGGNYTIKNLNVDSSKNLNVDSSAQTGKHYSSGLFGWAERDVTIKNVNVDGATIKGNHNVAVIVGYTYSGKISNCHVTNATIVCTHADNDACGDKAGGIVGYAGDESRFTNCSVSDSTVTAGRDAGQVIGCGYNVSVTNCTATKVTVSATGDCNKEGNINNRIIGRVIG